MKSHRSSIVEYSNLINYIPVYNQSARIKWEVWARISYRDKEKIENAIFGNSKETELSRIDVLSETDTVKRIIKTLMWGYPTGGRGNNIENILTRIDDLSRLLSSVNKQNLSKIQANNLIKEFEGIRGLGVSTWSKLLYFFNVEIDSRKCQIYDQKIVDSLNKKQFSELGTQTWKQDGKDYFQYIELLDKLATSMSVSPEQVEAFLFYYNLSYKF